MWGGRSARSASRVGTRSSTAEEQIIQRVCQRVCSDNDDDERQRKTKNDGDRGSSKAKFEIETTREMERASLFFLGSHEDRYTHVDRRYPVRRGRSRRCRGT